VQHSRSGAACGQLTVDVEVSEGRWVWVGVADEGGRTPPQLRDCRADDGADGRGLRIVAAVAAVVLLGWFGLSHWYASTLPRPEADQLATAALQHHHFSPPDRDAAENWFRNNGFPIVAAPDEFDYRFLFAYALAKPPGLDKPQRVPCLLFVRTPDQGRQSQMAWVYILSYKQFDLGALPNSSDPSSGSHFKCRVLHSSPGFAYVIVYSGDLDDLLVLKKERPGS